MALIETINKLIQQDILVQPLTNLLTLIGTIDSKDPRFIFEMLPEHKFQLELLLDKFLDEEKEDSDSVELDLMLAISELKTFMNDAEEDLKRSFETDLKFSIYRLNYLYNSLTGAISKYETSKTMNDLMYVAMLNDALYKASELLDTDISDTLYKL